MKKPPYREDILAKSAWIKAQRNWTLTQPASPTNTEWLTYADKRLVELSDLLSLL